MSIILVIEDEPDILEVTSVLLSSSGYDVLNARNAEDGFRLALSRDDIDVVFTDVNLGNGMSGTALVDRLREQGSRAAIARESPFEHRRRMFNGATHLRASRPTQSGEPCAAVP